MPTYEYECSKCSHLFEQFQSMRDEPLKKCPACGGKVKRLLGTGAGIIFKGSGFYQTDYRSSAYHSSVKAEKSSTKSDTPAASSSAGAGGTTAAATATAPAASAATPSGKKGRK